MANCVVHETTPEYRKCLYENQKNPTPCVSHDTVPLAAKEGDQLSGSKHCRSTLVSPTLRYGKYDDTQ